MHHVLKTLPPHFALTWDNNKLFEIRNNSDRSFQKGDTVTLIRFDPKAGPQHNTKFIDATITCVSNFAQKDDMVVFGIEITDQGILPPLRKLQYGIA
jgi:hypothetical protein